MTRYLTAEQILFIHSRIINETGGEFGIRDLGVLQSAVARPKATFDGKKLYPNIFSKAAALLESLVNNHPFVDGNKRIGITGVGVFLQMNGWFLIADNNQVSQFVLHVAQSEVGHKGIADWLEENCESK